ncbi:mitochondrial import translocase, subunit Tom22 [Ascodesmis nigricans]|uniref:Mitochondrial import translocase, subunit Tom22 n=1 Tax=Ascodesmis nigricans TaxID=341454 RepID=A0A4S2N1L0_9PEZI|nr:mitochondrial import translocase, subunit Tom22 [Ascodesmis nigricans]
MVKLTEVEDEHFAEEQAGPLDDDDFVDTDSSVSSEDELSEDEDEDLSETLYDRLVALKDIIPLKYRVRVSNAVWTVYSMVSGTLRFGGNAVWILSTSAIMLGVPYALAVGEEQQMVEMEKEMKAQQLAGSLSPNAHTSLEQPRKI